MNKKELVEKLKALKGKEINLFGNVTIDEEGNHIEADNLLLEYINDEEVTNAFKDIEKWYA